MHMSDALVSPAVAVGAGIAASTLIVIASKKVEKEKRTDLVALMGVMGAFVFAAQMINFTIPGTGSSGHLIGGVMLSAVLGPWAAFISLCSVLIVQCLVFADGGVMALGCNILNMAVTSCLIAYPLIYKPLASYSLQPWKIMTASVISSMVALEIGAFAVTIETELSGITALPMSTFLKFMLPIHAVIGLVEGIATGCVLIFVSRTRPSVLYGYDSEKKANEKSLKAVNMVILAATVILAGLFTWLASTYPDGLEWSIEKVSGLTDLGGIVPPTAFMPDYDSTLSGIVGAIIVMVLLWAFSSIMFSRLRKEKVLEEKHHSDN